MERQRIVQWHDPAEIVAHAATMTGLEFISKISSGDIPAPPIAELLGMDIIAVEVGRVVFRLYIGEHLFNPIGSVHGGAICTLLDSAMACAIQTKLPQGTIYTTTQLNVNFVRGLTTAVEYVDCEGYVVHGGRRLATAEGRVIDANGKLYAHGSTTCMVLQVGG